MTSIHARVSLSTYTDRSLCRTLVIAAIVSTFAVVASAQTPASPSVPTTSDTRPGAVESGVTRSAVFNAGAWLPPTRVTTEDDEGTFWGTSVHWNVSLQLYVMLLNRRKDERSAQEGIYVSFATRLDDPAAWTTPMKIGEGRSTQFIEFNVR